MFINTLVGVAEGKNGLFHVRGDPPTGIIPRGQACRYQEAKAVQRCESLRIAWRLGRLESTRGVTFHLACFDLVACLKKKRLVVLPDKKNDFLILPIKNKTSQLASLTL